MMFGGPAHVSTLPRRLCEHAFDHSVPTVTARPIGAVHYTRVLCDVMGMKMRSLVLAAVIGVLLLVGRGYFDAGAGPWIAGLLAWILFWSAILALVRSPRRATAGPRLQSR
jgi:hypothetical protein